MVTFPNQDDTMATKRTKRKTAKKTPKTRRIGLAKPVYTEEEVLALLDAACGPGNRRPGPSAVRNRALVAVLWRCGLRIGEALALTPADLVLEGDEPRELVLPCSKTESGLREVSLDLLARTELRRWLEVRRRVLGPRRAKRPSLPLFCTISSGSAGVGEAGFRTAVQPGEALSSSYVRGLLPRLGKRAGLTKRVHAHGLRRTHASELAAEGTPITVVQAQLGHAHASTTSVYLDEVGTMRKDLTAARLTKREREERAAGNGQDELVTRGELEELLAQAARRSGR